MVIMSINNSDGQKSSKSVVVIGAGITGLEIALKLCKAGMNVTVLERQKYPGGLAASIPYGDYRIDIGPHYLPVQRDSQRLKEIKEMMGDELIEIPIPNSYPSYRVYFKGRLYQKYPSLNVVIFDSGLTSFLSSIGSYCISKIRYTKNRYGSTEEYLISAYGKYLYHTWIKPIIKRKYGDVKYYPLDQIKKDYPPINFKRILSSFRGRLPLSSRKPLKNIKNSSDDNIFNCYFKNGMGSLAEKMQSMIQECGCKVLLETNVKSINHENPQMVTYIKNDQSFQIKADYIVYATPLSVTLQLIRDIPDNVKLSLGKILARNSIIVFLFIDTIRLYDGWLIEFYDPSLVFFRIAQQNVLSNNIAPGKTLLSVEISISDEDEPMWKMEELDLIERIKKDLKIANIWKEQEIDDYKIFKFKNVYPIPTSDRNLNINNIINFINSFKNEYTVGTLDANPDALVSNREITSSSDVKEDRIGIGAALSNTKRILEKITSDAKIN